MRNIHPDIRLSEMMEELCEKTDDDNSNCAIRNFIGGFTGENDMTFRL